MRIAHKKISEGSLVCYRNGWLTTWGLKDIARKKIAGIWFNGKLVTTDAFLVNADDPTS